MKILSILKTNWKKSVFATLAAGYGIYSLKLHYEITNHMRQISLEVVKCSKEVTDNNPKKLLVVINPTACGKKSEKSFQKYCEPILHLAGYSVEIFKTAHVGHAKAFVEKLNVLPDAIVIAGGDGTTSEVVTGLMRRKETPCPVAILPLGCKNESALKFINTNPKTELDYIKILSRSLLPLLHGKFEYENVIQYDVIGNKINENQNLKPIYGLNSFSWGLIKDIDRAKDRFWYFGFLKHYVAAFVKSFSDVQWHFGADYIYTPPCPGCSNCFIDKTTTTRTSFLSKLVSKKSFESPSKIYISNENCKTAIKGHIETNQLSIVCKKNDDNFYELESKFINTLYPGWEFIKNIHNIAKNEVKPSIVLKSRTIQLYPSSNISNEYYSIDGEEYDARPIKVSIIPKAIKVFH